MAIRRFEFQKTVTDFDAKKIEESIESLDRKLKIQQRKKKQDKATKTLEKLADLRSVFCFSPLSLTNHRVAWCFFFFLYQ